MYAGYTGAQVAAPANANFIVWDTQYVPPSRAFSFYREAICKVYMPWSPELDGEGEFQARIETAQVRNGSISRHRCSPHLSFRTAADIANSPTECSYLVLVLGGHIECEQGTSITFAGPGDILVVNSAWPTRVAMGRSPIDTLVVTIPESDLSLGRDADCQFSNVLLKQNRTPLSKCLILMAERMISASKDEMVSLYDAARSLLPLEAGCFDCHKKNGAETAKVNYLLRGILSYVDQNIASADLTPNRVADEFGISVRYVHKLFIGYGMTFCSYTTAKRLDHICKDLVSPACRQQPISLVAFRWGFNDLSSFNRAFKGRYGCTPSQFRMRSES